MRFQLEKPLKSNDYGKTRVIEKFLWFPKEINYEVRWLESVLIEQVVDYKFVLDTDYCEMSYEKYYWRDSKWIDPPINLK